VDTSLPQESKSTRPERNRAAAIALVGLGAGFATNWLTYGWSIFARMVFMVAAVVCASILAALLMRVRIRRE
jgi:hypothetical protein